MHRAARLCHGAAHGGQILLPASLAEAIIEEWTGEHLSLEGQRRSLEPSSASMSWPCISSSSYMQVAHF